eukprot:1158819-Pelagomonas_calceolata.AAC.9
MYACMRAQRRSLLSDEELQRFRDLPPTDQFGRQSAYVGGPVPPGQTPAKAPSRQQMQQLVDAGMVDALPEDVQTQMQLQLWMRKKMQPVLDAESRT